MNDDDEHPNPYIRYGVGTSEDVTNWSEAERRKHDPQWQTVESLHFLIRMQASLRGCLVTVIILLGLMLWRVW